MCGVKDPHIPARIVSLPCGPALPAHGWPAAIADHILPPLRICGVHAQPHAPVQGLLSEATFGARPQPVCAHDRVAAFQQADRDATELRRRGTGEDLAWDTPPAEARVASRLLVLQALPNPVLGCLLASRDAGPLRQVGALERVLCHLGEARAKGMQDR